MEQNYSKIKQRILLFLDYQKKNKRTFYSETGIANATLDKITGLGEENIERFISTYPQVNGDWLITGRGEMLKPTEDHAPPSIVSEPEETYKKLTKPVKQGIPLIPMAAFAGLASGDVNILELDCERYVIPSFQEADFLIPVKGGSMRPKYNSGDIVACKWLPLDTFFQWNKVYVLDTIQGPLIKRVRPGETTDALTIVSENEKYPSYQLSKTEIRKLALVIGVIRLE